MTFPDPKSLRMGSQHCCWDHLQNCGVSVSYNPTIASVLSFVSHVCGVVDC